MSEYPSGGPGGYGQNPHQPGPPPQQQPGYGYPGPGSYPSAPPVQPYAGVPGYAPQLRPDNGLGTAGLVCGIIGAVCGLVGVLWFFALILGILAIIFGAVGRGRFQKGEATNGSAATAGIVLGIVSLIFPLLWVLFVASIFGMTL